MNRFSRRLILASLLLFVIVCVACGKDNNPSNPTGQPGTTNSAGNKQDNETTPGATSGEHIQVDPGTKTPTKASNPTPTLDPDDPNCGGEIDDEPVVTPAHGIGGATATPTPTSGVENLIDPDKDQNSAGLEGTDIKGEANDKAEVKDADNPLDSAYTVNVNGVTVSLCAYSGLTLNPVSSIEVDTAVAQKLASQSYNEYIDAPAQLGDFVNITYFANVIDDENTYENAYSEDGLVSQLGTGEFILSFEPNIVGKRAGEVVSYEYTFDSGYFDPRFAGKTAVFSITINSVYRVVHPTLSDDSVRRYFDCEKVSDFVYKVKQEVNRKSYVNQIWDYLGNNCSASNIKKTEISEYSDYLYSRYINYVDAHTYEYDFDSLACLRSLGFPSFEALRDQTDAVARSRIENYYIIMAIVKDLKINLTEEEYYIRFDEYITSLDPSSSVLGFDYNEFEVDLGIYTNVVMDFIISKANFSK